MSTAPSDDSPMSHSLDAPEEPPEQGAIAALGASFIDLLNGGREVYSVFVRTLYYVARGKREKGALAAQMFEMGNRSLFFICITMGFIGMILVYQAGLQAKRVVPDFTMLGATYMELLVRDFAASIGALMLATRIGAGIAAEIGSMVVTEQIDALRMCSADPIDFLIVPRFISSVIMTTVLIVIAGTVAFCAGGATAYFGFDVAPQTFFNTQLVDFGDLTTGLTKCLAYGAAIPIVSGYCGLSTFGGSEGVGWATTRAVVNSSLAIIILNFFISGASFLIFPGLTSQAPMIEFRNIKKSFGPKQVLNDVSFDVRPGEVFFIIGASGVGKSVLIKHLVGLLYPDAGEIWLDGEEISNYDEEAMGPVRKKCAMVFQHATLFDSMTCAENVALPLRKHKGLTYKESLAEARRRLEVVHMRDFADHYPSGLGDGMRKRVAIARALTLDPKYVLFDEPTTSLDPVSARRVDRLIRELSDKLGVTSVVVSHDLASIFTIASRIVMLYKGKVKMLGTPEDFRASPDGVVQQFINGHASGPMEA